MSGSDDGDGRPVLPGLRLVGKPGQVGPARSVVLGPTYEGRVPLEASRRVATHRRRIVHFGHDGLGNRDNCVNTIESAYFVTVGFAHPE
jgi:hypothetical protein